MRAFPSYGWLQRERETNISAFSLSFHVFNRILALHDCQMMSRFERLHAPYLLLITTQQLFITGFQSCVVMVYS